MIYLLRLEVGSDPTWWGCLLTVYIHIATVKAIEQQPRLASPPVAQIRRSKLHYGSTDDLSSSEQIEIFVDLVELEKFERVANLALRSKCHDFGQVDVAAPEGTFHSP
jgi:hypothetical protein